MIQEDLYYPDDDYPEDYSGGEIIETEDDEEAEYIEINGQMVKIGPVDIDDVVFVFAPIRSPTIRLVVSRRQLKKTE